MRITTSNGTYEAHAVQARRAGVVHIALAPGTAPICHPWAGPLRFRRVTAAPTCKRCLSGRHGQPGD